MNPNTTKKDLTLGSVDSLQILIKWEAANPSSCSNVSDASWGGLLLYVQKTLVWGEPNGSDFLRLECDWVSFLRHLTVAWPYLINQQDYPSYFQFDQKQIPSSPGLFRANVEKSWEDNIDKNLKEQEEDAMFNFLHFHDLASGLPGTGVDPLVLLRQGNILLASSGYYNWRLDYNQCINTLAEFGDQIVLRVQHTQDARLKNILERWSNRDQ